MDTSEIYMKLIQAKLKQKSSSFNINELYTPILIVMIIWYLLIIKQEIPPRIQYQQPYSPQVSGYQSQQPYPPPQSYSSMLSGYQQLQYNPY